MDNKEEIAFVRDYIIRKIVKGYIVGDLKRLLSIKVIPNHDGNCNFPIALYVLTSMSFLGYLISERELINDWERINAYIDGMFREEDKAKIEPHRAEFTNKFRNGLAHEFFPKMAGISRVNSELMTLSEEGYWVLDADILADMFIKSADNLENATRDEAFCLRMFSRYNEIQRRNLELKNRPLVTTTNVVRSSGATTTTLPYESNQGDMGLNISRSKGDTGASGLKEYMESIKKKNKNENE